MTMLTDQGERALERIAPLLNALVSKANPSLKYAAFKDALFWSDEVLSGPEDDDEMILWHLLRYRTLVLIGEPATALEALWNAAKERCPKWPGFLPERIVPTEELRNLYLEWSEAAIKSVVDGIDD